MGGRRFLLCNFFVRIISENSADKMALVISKVMLMASEVWIFLRIV